MSAKPPDNSRPTGKIWSLKRRRATARVATHDLIAVDAAAMSDEHREVFDSARPAVEEIAADRWSDEAVR